MPLTFRWGLVLVVLLLLVPLFGHLDHLPIRLWDEARLAKNAAEMADNGNWMVPHYEGQPDMWNTKPPLMIWLQVLLLKLIGFSETAIRLPSALSAAATLLLMYWLLARKLAAPWLGLLSVLVLLTIPGYIGLHAVRTGDYDALLACFTTAYCLLFFWYLETGSTRMLLGFFLTLAGAVLAKGIAGLLFGPALLIYALFRKQTLRMFTQRTFYLGLLVFVLVAVGYYGWREHLNPGYIAAVQQNEWGGRYLQVSELHEANGWYYWGLITDVYCAYWYLPAIGGILAGLNTRDNRLRRLTIYLTLLCLTFLIVLSQGATKLDWYLVPVYPFIAILAGILLWTVFNYLQAWQGWEAFQRINLLPYLLLLFACALPYSRIISQVTDPGPDGGAGIGNFYINEYLKDVLHGMREARPFKVAAHHKEANIIWYITALQKEKQQVNFTETDSLQPGTEVLVYEEDMRQRVDSLYQTGILDQYFNLTLFRIDGRRPSQAPDTGNTQQPSGLIRR